MRTFDLMLSLLLLFVLSSCEKTDTGYDCEAIVIDNVNSSGFVSCSKPVFNLKFTRGETMVQSVTEGECNVTDSLYPVLDIPEELQVIGMTIRLDVRKPRSGEVPACYNFEMPVLLGCPVTVVRAEKK